MNPKHRQFFLFQALYEVIRHTALVVHTAAPPVSCLKLLFVRSSQSGERWLKRERSCKSSFQTVKTIYRGVQEKTHAYVIYQQVRGYKGAVCVLTRTACVACDY